jgi:hypothetical protein
VATLLITALTWRSFGPFHAVIAYFIYSAARAFTPCVILGMPATAVALWRGPRRLAFQAVASGLAVAATGFAIIAMALNAGAAAVSGILPTLLIFAAEFWLAFKLRSRMRRRLRCASLRRAARAALWLEVPRARARQLDAAYQLIRVAHPRFPIVWRRPEPVESRRPHARAGGHS